MFGFLNVYKPKGKTSHDVVAILRKICKIKQIGHTGTLDPFAEGVLPICIGKATRLIEYLNDDKAYIGTIQLGSSTSTFDIEGETKKTSSKKVSLEDVEKEIDNFRGEISQVPPIFSAIKMGGKKLYEYARKGEEVEIKPRTVCINDLKILNFNQETQSIEVYISCSKGTYIRSIANDLGEKLGTFAFLSKLIRVKAGDFLIDKSIRIEDLQTNEDVQKNLIYPLEYLSNTKYEIFGHDLDKISHGMSINYKGKNEKIILVSDKKLIAIGESLNGIIKPIKVFL